MEQSALSLNWPATGLLLGVIALLLFKNQFRRLLDRAKEIGPGGVKIQEPQQLPAPAETPTAMKEFNRTWDNSLRLEVEQRIRDELESRGLVSPNDREEALVRALAGSHLATHFERAFSSIFASQLAAMVKLNGMPAGASLDDIRPFYDAAAVQWPAIYGTYSFDAYLGYLTSYMLIERGGDNVAITLAGREFLKFIVDSRKALPSHG